MKDTISGIGSNIKGFGAGVGEKVGSFFGKSQADVNITVSAEKGSSVRVKDVKGKNSSLNLKAKSDLGSIVGAFAQ